MNKILLQLKDLQNQPMKKRFPKNNFILYTNNIY